MGNATGLSTDTVTFGYSRNTAGRVSAITSTLNDSQHPGTLLSGVHYNALGEITSGTMGNNLAVSYSYFQRGWLYSTNQQRY
ncbi:MAG TPA: hypothetical protein VEG30_15240, partial [Terriglobales bacterium]|nr:hypothetical protein [Terriglobales bacterium]